MDLPTTRDDARRRVKQSSPRLGRGNKNDKEGGRAGGRHKWFERVGSATDSRLVTVRLPVATACAAASFYSPVSPAEPGARLSDAPARVVAGSYGARQCCGWGRATPSLAARTWRLELCIVRPYRKPARLRPSAIKTATPNKTHSSG